MELRRRCEQKVRLFVSRCPGRVRVGRGNAAAGIIGTAFRILMFICDALESANSIQKFEG
jgi:hypothetical protein